MLSPRLLFNQAVQSLQPVYDAGEARNIAFMLLENKLGLTRAAVLADKPVAQINETDWQSWLARLENHEPIQYVLEETEFCGRTFHVNAHVLIPRPETEELLAWIVAGEISGKTFLDIGTGSGCIAVTLAKENPLAEVWAIDVSAEALAVARRNADAHQAAVHFREMDFLTGHFPTGFPDTFDLVVSNPPYVTLSEKSAMQRNVLDFEPATALFVPDNDPLLFYRHIARFCQLSLTANGKYCVEINENLARETVRLMEAHKLTAEVRHDLYGKPRFVGGGREQNRTIWVATQTYLPDAR